MIKPADGSICHRVHKGPAPPHLQGRAIIIFKFYFFDGVERSMKPNDKTRRWEHLPRSSQIPSRKDLPTIGLMIIEK